MEIKKAVEQILAKPVSRKQFLGHAGVAALSLVGVTSFLKSIGGKASSKGYGASSYGGRTKL